MTVEFVLGIIKLGLSTAAMMAAPILITALVVGVLISLFTAVTQINEATLTFVPKVVAVGSVFLILLPWLMEKANWFMTYIFSNLHHLIR